MLNIPFKEIKMRKYCGCNMLVGQLQIRQQPQIQLQQPLKVQVGPGTTVPQQIPYAG